MSITKVRLAGEHLFDRENMSHDFSMILEAGVNHDGDKERAFQLVESAAKSGADYIKFQTYTSEKLAARLSPSYWDLNEESTTSQRELFSKYDGFTTQDYFELATEANRLGIGFMTTCFDVDWVDALDSILPQYKIASADITNFSLLSHIARKGKPLLISTGAATFEEIHDAVRLVRDISQVKISLLHCVLNYPTSPENASLARITRLIEEFPGIEIGYSDHTKPVDSFRAIQCAYDLGARVFEKHFTWDSSGIGNDHYHSFTENEASALIGELKKNRLLLTYNDKHFLEVQEAARLFARRGLYAKRDLQVGEVIRETDLIPLRPPIGTEGFFGNQIDSVIGRKVSSAIIAGDAILRNSLS